MERQIIQEFIDIYRSEPSLWKVRSAHYNNKTVKNLAYRRMMAKLRELYPAADIEMVKKKINALRTNYRKELRKVEASKQRNIQTGAPVYVPSLWYYDLFHFIADQENEAADDVADGIDVQELLRVDLDENICFENEDSDASYEEFQASRPNSPENRELKMYQAPSQHSMNHDSSSFKRKRVAVYKPEEEYGGKPEIILDDHDVFGKYVASKLRKMEKPMQMFSERLISEILYRGQMGMLGPGTSVQEPEVPVLADSVGCTSQKL
ncbi:uncharacterized protein LOC129217322 [Uloborus diversus]|uniref:uncharacterized protein LOC129217322 n=1 Tax=Uloborus diversus TaxID=327109 RepID=UPI00240A7A31|nr:uncharacterized protein LOC129217322 [Uloborus diversus]